MHSRCVPSFSGQLSNYSIFIMKDSKNEKYWKWIGILLAISFGSILTWLTIREIKFSNNHRYTIATTKGHGGGGSIDFEFTVSGVTYARGDKGKSLTSNGRKYFVKYYVPDPSVLAKVVSNEEVPECIGEPPADGWKEIPKCKE